MDRTIWQSSEGMEGTWVRGEVAYTYGSVHKIILKALAKKLDDADRAYRGYVAVDDVQFQPIDEAEEQCKGHCTFEGGLCSWTNQEENDEFDWTLGRGSQNIFTGPSRDFTSFGQNEQSGGFVYIESSFPRRPGDRAMLVSPLMNPTEESNPLCMKFATHMYGNGIGTLRVRLRYTGDEERPEKILWEMKGEAGNNWYLGQVPVSSPAQAYHVVIEGIVGQNSLGNIAIDNLSFQVGTCPISPQTASRGSGDCTFEENMCLWHNPLPHSRVDDFDWLRQYSFGGTGPKYDHTKKTPEGYFINLSGDALQPQRGGTRAWLLSPEFTPQTTTPKCLSFYYYMFERTIDPAGPSLGSLRVYIKTLSDNGEQLNLVWRLNNHQAQGWRPAKVPLALGLEKKPPLQTYQILIEGIWGDGRVGTIAIDDISFFDGNCAPQPTKAAAVMGECSFERDLCGYRNQSGTGPGPEVTQFSSQPSKAALISNKRQSLNRLSVSSKESLTWKLATPTSRPANLQDHTFRAPTGYLFFDVFNQNSMQYPVLRSPEFPGGEGNTPKCLSFWFTPFGRGETTLMSVSMVTQGDAEGNPPPEETDKKGNGGPNALTIETKSLLWRMSTRRFDTSRPEWIYGQLAINSETPYRIQFEGEASDGGFALDDITFYDGLCQREGNTPKCLSFWFTPFGRGETTLMSVSMVTQGDAEGNPPPEETDKKGNGGPNALTIETKSLLWRMSTRRFDTSRPEWIYGQLAINSETPYRIQFEGEASDGGFALDDITFYDGLCQTRPLQAAVASNTQSDNLNVNEKSLREQ
ncbi:unnamed protein product [Oppiella nova]|uniref:MAM domain-containing protein n=2 Tax=Oppiella nova TaxID=334625 RepID=A0A7R9QNS9_9ACAR|nr:unnamed protein product [Oppiella nova]CAG2170061.1 unnamed protein product [Oppiella nova]